MKLKLGFFCFDTGLFGCSNLFCYHVYVQKITHKIQHQLQPSATSCGYTALSTLLSHYDFNKPPEELIRLVPQPKTEDGKPTGSITAQLATWCLQQEFKVNFYSFDFQIIDLSWTNLEGEALIRKLELIKDVRDVPSLGKQWSAIYAQAYIDLLQKGGKLKIMPHVTSKLIYDLLKDGPVYANICSYLTHGLGRLKYPDPEVRKAVTDEVHGSIGTHSVVIYGNDEEGNYLVSDPWHGLEVVNPETMLCGITAACIECDSQLFQLTS
jgi:hypothetical protein